MSRISFLCKVILPPRLTAILRLRNMTLRMGLQFPNTSTPHKVHEQLPHLLQCQVYDSTPRASTSVHRSAEKRDDNHKTALKQAPPTIKTGNIQTHARAKTKPEGTRKNKKNHLCRPQQHIKHRVPKHRKKWTRNTKPGYTKNSSKQQWPLR